MRCGVGCPCSWYRIHFFLLSLFTFHFTIHSPQFTFNASAAPTLTPGPCRRPSARIQTLNYPRFALVLLDRTLANGPIRHGVTASQQPGGGLLMIMKLEECKPKQKAEAESRKQNQKAESESRSRKHKHKHKQKHSLAAAFARLVVCSFARLLPPSVHWTIHVTLRSRIPLLYCTSPSPLSAVRSVLFCSVLLMWLCWLFGAADTLISGVSGSSIHVWLFSGFGKPFANSPRVKDRVMSELPPPCSLQCSLRTTMIKWPVYRAPCLAQLRSSG